MLMTSTFEHRFNGDLLIGTHDQVLAKEQYAQIIHILDHPELRQEFSKYDRIATRARMWVQRLGLLAVLLTAIALLSAATAPLLHQLHGVPEWVIVVLFWAEIGGLVGVVIAGGGMWIAGNKKKWLEARMMAEILRLWHFQSFICRGNEIELSCNTERSSAVADYSKARASDFKRFVHEWSGSLDSHLLELIEKPESGYQMLHDEPSQYTPDNPLLDEVFDAYKSLRFRHQANYAAHKLQTQTTNTFSILKWPSAVLQSRIQNFAAFCLLGSLCCSSLIVIGQIAHIDLVQPILLPVAVIVFLVLTVSGRAIQDGLAASGDHQRYNDYCDKIRYIYIRFEASNNAVEKLGLMAEMERAALEELKGFLRAHLEARFVI